jgi:hypothetical protein
MFAFSSCRRVLLVLTLMLAPALAQTSSTLLKGDQAAAYEQLKQTFQALPPFNSAMSSSALYDSVNPNTYNLANCQDGSEFLAYGTHRDVVLDRLADLALQIILWSTDLRTLGYPEQVWRPLLSNFEQAQLRLIQNVGPAATEASYETIRHPYQTFAPRLSPPESSAPPHHLRIRLRCGRDLRPYPDSTANRKRRHHPEVLLQALPGAETRRGKPADLRPLA